MNSINSYIAIAIMLQFVLLAVHLIDAAPSVEQQVPSQLEENQTDEPLEELETADSEFFGVRTKDGEADDYNGGDAADLSFAANNNNYNNNNNDDEDDDDHFGAGSTIDNAKIEVNGQDLDTAAGHHHHHKHYVSGKMEMGAHTKKKGAFGWHAKYPVGGKGR